MVPQIENLVFSIQIFYLLAFYFSFIEKKWIKLQKIELIYSTWLVFLIGIDMLQFGLFHFLTTSSTMPHSQIIYTAYRENNFHWICAIFFAFLLTSLYFPIPASYSLWWAIHSISNYPCDIWPFTVLAVVLISAFIRNYILYYWFFNTCYIQS